MVMHSDDDDDDDDDDVDLALGPRTNLSWFSSAKACITIFMVTVISIIKTIIIIIIN